MVIRILDFLFSLFGLFILFPIMLLVFFVGLFESGSPVFVQTRMGKNMKPFKLIKFRTMRKDTESVASHLASSGSITKVGAFLRRTKVDELPQLINVLKGDMSLVGPRPNLLNQKLLIHERNSLNVYDVLPGITGLAQINNIDMSTPELLAQKDRLMIDTLSIKGYLNFIVMTVTGKGGGDAVKPHDKA